VRYIKWSYRIRGRVARIQIKRVLKNNVINGIFVGGHGMKRVTVSRLIIKIFAYSAIKINAKLLLLYSMLNPDTSSDSPSERSNGVRLVSARRVMNHRSIIGNKNIIGGLVIEREE
jgi:hypothetical protein